MGVIPFFAIEGKAGVFCDWEDRLLIMDCLIYCRFYRDMVQWPYITAVVNAAIGTDYTEEDMHRIANRIITMTHEFNAARGIGRETERLPHWISETPMDDEGGLVLPESELEYMLADYYRIRGWGELPPPPRGPAGARGRGGGGGAAPPPPPPPPRPRRSRSARCCGPVDAAGPLSHK
jgi:aldehyde:ferredoxin oxidoreductase